MNVGVKFFGREPVLFLTLVLVVTQLISAFWVKVTPDQQTIINITCAAVVGLIVAIVAHDSLSAPILGAVQAVVAAAVGFGLNWTVDQQAIVLSVASAIVALFVRSVVVAPVSAGGVRVRKSANSLT